MKLEVARLSVGDSRIGALRGNVGAIALAHRLCLQVPSLFGGRGGSSSDEIREEGCHAPWRSVRSTPRSAGHVFTTAHAQHQRSINGEINQELFAAWHGAAPMSANSGTFTGAIADWPVAGDKSFNAIARVWTRRGAVVSIGTEKQWQRVWHVKLGRGQYRRSRHACNDAAFCLSRGAA